MNDIFNFFGSILGYLLWWLYYLVGNYGVAIILFTLIVKMFLFPFFIKQQRSMAATAKLSVKQKEIQKKYANDKQRMQIEMQKLYEKEGVNPSGGCLTMILPFLVMFGLYYTVLNPLSNALHLSSEAVNKAVAMLNHVPGIGNSFNTQYAQIEIVKNFTNLKPFLGMFSGDELARLESFNHGFRFLGLNLLDTPCDASNIFGTLFRSNLWIIPVLCLVVYLSSQFITTKMMSCRAAATAAGLREIHHVHHVFRFRMVCLHRSCSRRFLLDCLLNSGLRAERHYEQMVRAGRFECSGRSTPSCPARAGRSCY
jgi:YidC/Oxa1 family membrane protein insertase